MSKNTAVAVVGAGSIGKHLIGRLGQIGIPISFIRTSRKTESQNTKPFNELLKDKHPQAIFLSIPTTDHGEIAYTYIMTAVEMGIPVITCEKGALAYYADVLRPYSHLIGYSATVGGGTHMLRYVQNRFIHLSGPVEIQAVINGTLNYIFDEMSRGRSLDEACKEACKLGYAEPGATDPLSLINGELFDIVLKTCVVLNIGLGIKNHISPHDILHYPLSEDDLETLARDGAEYRFVVSISNGTKLPMHSYHKHIFTIKECDRVWNVVAGFKRVSTSDTWLPSGVSNAIHITEGKLGAGGKYTLTGPGAGAEPTTSAMLADYYRICSP